MTEPIQLGMLGVPDATLAELREAALWLRLREQHGIRKGGRWRASAARGYRARGVRRPCRYAGCSTSPLTPPA
jgi:hypothetical protein